MSFIKKNIFIITAIVIGLSVFTFYFVRNYRASKTIYESLENEEYKYVPKVYGVNEYSNVSISNDTLVNLYFNDLKKSVQHDISKSYLLVDEKYRNIKFNSLEDYKKYIEGLNLSTAKIKNYKIYSSGEYKIYEVYDTKENVYIFKVEGVMLYTLYFDNYTVEIR